MAFLRYQFELFCLALSFFSRLPVPANTPYSPERMNQSGRYFALVGALLGGLCALFYTLAAQLVPFQVAILLMIAFSLLLTGAFHEDGLTDMADGIGGGMTVEKRLTIMKDSRIGTYGSATLTMALLGKFVFLTTLARQADFVLILIVAYTLSRAVAASLIYDMPYVSDADQSKSKPLASAQSSFDLAVLLFCGVIAALTLGMAKGLLLLLVAALFRIGFKRWLMARLGGFTGDCLGAAQQLMELGIYLVLIAMIHNG
ncbi:adenosylcobinamide-GDP ribazoletransferase [Vibrio cidicii]|nr:adenosylcobinamide-GDP ribazoletransferase [Vibrio cidicii]